MLTQILAHLIVSQYPSHSLEHLGLTGVSAKYLPPFSIAYHSFKNATSCCLGVLSNYLLLQM